MYLCLCHSYSNANSMRGSSSLSCMISSLNTSGNIKPSMQKTDHHFWLVCCAQVPQSKRSLFSEGVYRCNTYIFGRTHKAGEWHNTLVNPRDSCSHAGHTYRKSEHVPTQRPSARCTTAYRSKCHTEKTDSLWH